MKLKRKDFVSVGVLLIIISVLIFSVFAVPTFINIKNSFEISKYENVKANIIDSAKSKFSASVNDIGKDEVVEYSVKQLIEEGYLNSNEKNPLTGRKYDENDKVLVISKNGEISYKFINGSSLINQIKEDKSVKYIDNEYYYIGPNPNNYVILDEQIYRVLKIDINNNVYLISDEVNKKISKNNINIYLSTYINDNFSLTKSFILGVTNLDFKEFKKTKDNENQSFIDNDNYFWVNDNNELKVYDTTNKVFLDNIDKAWINPVIKIDNSLVIEKGNGTRINPYILSK